MDHNVEEHGKSFGRRTAWIEKMGFMGSGVTWMMATLVVTASALVHATKFDGRPRPDGFDDLPTTTLGTKPVVKYAGTPADCTWYSWENHVLPPKGTENCSDMLWSDMISNTSELEAYTYSFYEILFASFATLSSNPSARCIIGCFDLSATSPNHSTAQPPVSATIPPEASIQAPTPSVKSSPPLPLSSSPAPTPSEPPRPSAPASKSQVGLIAGICASGFVGILLGLVFLFFCCFKRVKSLDNGAEQALAIGASSRPYTFKELSAITRNFDTGELLSSGAFGDVFKGTLASGGALVAVKRIRREKEHGHASFLAEANTLSQIRHRHLLQLRGWCECKEGLFLVYDFMRNGSLDKWIHDGNPSSLMPWSARRSVLAGVAAGLEYLHEGWVQCVLHRDIKSSNVMLDAEFNACLGDFGLARLVDHQKQEKTTIVAGTLGYMAPEMLHTGRATRGSDVFAFGVLVLEVVCGRRPLDMSQDVEPEDFVLLDRVWRAHEAGTISEMVDSRLASDQELLAMVAKVLQLGLLCCLPNPSERPSIRLVSHWFQSLDAAALEFPSLPASRPAPPAQLLPMPEGTSSSYSSGSTCS